MRRKGELSAASIDHGWPHQVVLPARLCERDSYNQIHEFCRDLTTSIASSSKDSSTWNGKSRLISKMTRRGR